jgi:hypothetical protein
MPLQNEAAPDDHSHTMEDPMARNNWSDVDAAPALEAGG